MSSAGKWCLYAHCPYGSHSWACGWIGGGRTVSLYPLGSPSPLDGGGATKNKVLFSLGRCKSFLRLALRALLISETSKRLSCILRTDNHLSLVWFNWWLCCTGYLRLNMAGEVSARRVQIGFVKDLGLSFRDFLNYSRASFITNSTEYFFVVLLAGKLAPHSTK